MASKRLAATKAELEEVTAWKRSSYLGLCAGDLSIYVAQLREKERLLSQIAQLQVQHLKPARPAPPGPAATFDRCSLPNVVQHMLDYEAVASECTKALRALASLAYNDVNEVAAHRSCMAQLLRLVQLHSDDVGVQLAAMKCFCHLAFSQDIARRELAEHDILDALMAARSSSSAEVRKFANEATARIIMAESSGKRPSGALLHILRAEAKRGMQSMQSPTNLKHILSDLEEFDVNIFIERFIEAAPASETCEIDEAVGWLSLLVNLLGQIPLVCPAAVTITTSLMDAFPRSWPIQKQGVAAMSALAASRDGPLQLAEAKGVKRVETALGAPSEDAELPASCINFLVLVLDWPFEIQKLCDVDYLRVVSLTKEAMQRHLDVVSLQVVALQGLAKIVEVLSVASDMKEGGAEGLIKTVLAHHKDQKQVWTWGRILLDNMGLDRHWTLREK